MPQLLLLGGSTSPCNISPGHKKEDNPPASSRYLLSPLLYATLSRITGRVTLDILEPNTSPLLYATLSRITTRPLAACVHTIFAYTTNDAGCRGAIHCARVDTSAPQAGSMMQIHKIIRPSTMWILHPL